MKSIKPLTKTQAYNCEHAKEKTCRCRCGGKFHGAGRVGSPDGIGSMPADFSSLPIDDPHYRPQMSKRQAVRFLNNVWVNTQLFDRDWKARHDAGWITLFNECFRIQHEAIQAAGHYIPLIVENVCGAQRWVGRARWHFGSYYLWGDVPALMPYTMSSVKCSGINWSDYGKDNYKSVSFNYTNERKFADGRKFEAQPEYTQAHKGHIASGWSANRHDDYLREMLGRKINTSCAPNLWKDRQGDFWSGGIKQGGEWWHDNEGLRRYNSRSNLRKAASAHIAKIPFPLAQHIARCFK